MTHPDDPTPTPTPPDPATDTGEQFPFPTFPLHVRAWLYSVLLAAAGLLLIYGVATESELSAWLGFAASLLGTGSAALHTFPARHKPNR